MKEMLLRQDNRITSARYELSVIEKRVMYFMLKHIRKQYVLSDAGQRDLFNDLIIKIDGSALIKEVDNNHPSDVRKALKSLRLRSFEYEDEENDNFMEVGFINYHKWEKGQVEVQISKEILPFYVELTSRYTEYSLVVAMGLRSKWSQRIYELCAQWRSAGGFRLTIEDLRLMFKLEEEYNRYASLKLKVLEVAKVEIKKLYDKGQCDLYFEYSENKDGRSVRSLNFKIISSKTENAITLQDLDYAVRTELSILFETRTRPKNNEFLGKVMNVLRLNPEDLNRCYQKILFTKQTIPNDEQARYLRYVLNEEFLKTDTSH